MEATGEETIQPQHPDQPSESGRLSRLECLGGVIVSPVKAFEHLAGKPQWFLPLIIVVLYPFVAYVAPMIASLADMMTGTKAVGSEALGFFTPMFIVIMFFMNMVMSITITAIVFFGMAGALYVIARLFKIRPNFYALASTLAYAEFVPRLSGSAIKKFISLFVEKAHPLMPDFPTGIIRIFSEFDVPILLLAFLARIELFHLWSFALVAIAVRFVAKVSNERAMLITLLYWAVCILAVAGIGALSDMSALLFYGL